MADGQCAATASAGRAAQPATNCTGLTASAWGVRAERLLEQALSDVRDGVDAIPVVTAALTALRAETGDVPPDDMDGYTFPGEQRERAACLCPPALRTRGGWRSGCPEHDPGAAGG